MRDRVIFRYLSQHIQFPSLLISKLTRFPAGPLIEDITCKKKDTSFLNGTTVRLTRLFSIFSETEPEIVV